MNIRTKNILFFCAVLASRIPFLFEGYGLDGDAWGVALSAMKLRSFGHYEVSRFPGYPVEEFLSSLFITDSYFTLNLLTALVSTAGILFFVRTLQELKFRSPYFAGAALAAVPVLYINSTLPLDYTFALAFQLAALFLIVRRRLLFAGLVMGLAIGTRITSVLLVIPFLILLYSDDGLRTNLLRFFRFLVPAFAVGILCFYPVYQRYGWDFLTYYDVPYPSIPKVLYKFFVEVWGIVGCVALLIGIALLLFPERATKTTYLFPRSVGLQHVTAWIIAIDLYIIAFVKLPMEAGYLLPIIPFVILLFGRYLIPPAFRAVCLLCMASPFLVSLSPLDRKDAETPSALSVTFNAFGEQLVVDALQGPVTAFESRRTNSMRYNESVLARMDSVQHPAVLICGQWYNQLILMNKNTRRGFMSIAPHIGEEEILTSYSQGNYLYYLSRQDRLNVEVKGADPAHYGAALFDR